MAKKFPNTLYVKIEGDDGEEYFVSDDAVINLAKIGECIRVGVYKLDDIAYAEVDVKTRSMRRRK